MYTPAYSVLPLSRRAMLAYVQILHPFTDRTFHKPYLCTCCSLCSPGHFSFQFGNVDSPSKKGFSAHLCRGKLSAISLGTPCSVPYQLCGPYSSVSSSVKWDRISNLPGLLWRVTKHQRSPFLFPTRTA